MIVSCASHWLLTFGGRNGANCCLSATLRSQELVYVYQYTYVSCCFVNSRFEIWPGCEISQAYPYPASKQALEVGTDRSLAFAGPCPLCWRTVALLNGHQARKAIRHQPVGCLPGKACSPWLEAQVDILTSSDRTVHTAACRE